MEVALEFEFDKAEELRRALIEACGEVKETLDMYNNEYKGNSKLLAGGMHFSDYLVKRQEMLEAKAEQDYNVDIDESHDDNQAIFNMEEMEEFLERDGNYVNARQAHVLSVEDSADKEGDKIRVFGKRRVSLTPAQKLQGDLNMSST